jgi:hypothetical protein
MNNIDRINSCIQMLNRIKRINAHVNIDEYSKDIDTIFNLINDLDDVVISRFIDITTEPSSTISSEQFWATFEASNPL